MNCRICGRELVPDQTILCGSCNDDFEGIINRKSWQNVDLPAANTMREQETRRESDHE